MEPQRRKGGKTRPHYPIDFWGRFLHGRRQMSVHMRFDTQGSYDQKIGATRLRADRLNEANDPALRPAPLPPRPPRREKRKPSKPGRRR